MKILMDITLILIPNCMSLDIQLVKNAIKREMKPLINVLNAILIIH